MIAVKYLPVSPETKEFEGHIQLTREDDWCKEGWQLKEINAKTGPFQPGWEAMLCAMWKSVRKKQDCHKLSLITCNTNKR